MTLKKIQSNKKFNIRFEIHWVPCATSLVTTSKRPKQTIFPNLPPSVQGPVPSLPIHVITYLTWTLLEVLCCRKVMFSVMSVCQSSCSRGVPTVQPPPRTGPQPSSFPAPDMFKLFQPGPHYTGMLSTLRYVQTFSTWTSLHRDAVHSQICSNFFNLDLTTQGCSPL